MPRKFDLSYAAAAFKGLLNRTIWDNVMRDVDARIADLEEVKPELESAITDLTKVGLDRINSVLQPAVQKVITLADLGFLLAHSSTPFTLNASNGNIFTFIVDEGVERDLFTPSPFVTISRQANYIDYAFARTIGYDAPTGKFTCQILALWGDPGPHSDWVISDGSGVTQAVQQMMADTQAARDIAIQAKTDANTAKTTASTAATAASQSAALAQQASQLYLGAQSSDPTQGLLLPDGSHAALVVGNWYLNTSSNPRRVRVLESLSPNSWIDAASPANFIPVAYDFPAATAGQTVFQVPQGFDGGFVYVNGRRLLSSEYTLTSPNVVLTAPAVGGELYSFDGWQYRTTPASADPGYSQAEVNTIIATRDATIAANAAAATASINQARAASKLFALAVG